MQVVPSNSLKAKFPQFTHLYHFAFRRSAFSIPCSPLTFLSAFWSLFLFPCFYCKSFSSLLRLNTNLTFLPSTFSHLSDLPTNSFRLTNLDHISFCFVISKPILAIIWCILSVGLSICCSKMPSFRSMLFKAFLLFLVADTRTLHLAVSVGGSVGR